MVQDMKPIKPRGAYIAKGNRYGIAVAESIHQEHYEYASKAQASRDELRLCDDLSPGRAHLHTVTPKGHGVIRPSSPTGQKSPRQSPPRSPRVKEMGRSGQMLLLRSTESSLCVAWSAVGKVPHTLSLGGKPIAVLDPLKDKRNGQLCFTVTHLKPLKQYSLSVDVGGKPHVYDGIFTTATSEGIARAKTQKRPMRPAANDGWVGPGMNKRSPVPQVNGIGKIAAESPTKQRPMSARGASSTAQPRITGGSGSQTHREFTFADDLEDEADTGSAFPGAGASKVPAVPIGKALGQRSSGALSARDTRGPTAPAASSGSRTQRTPRDTDIGKPRKTTTPNAPASTYSPSTNKLF